MKRRGIIKGVLHNFLGTYTSRYSDHSGYWLFGILVDAIGELRIDLLCPTADGAAPPPVSAAVRLAAQKFREQMEKAGLSIECAREALLDITKSAELHRGFINGHLSTGHSVRFAARVVSDRGKVYSGEISFFIAPHNPEIERRSTRGPIEAN